MTFLDTSRIRSLFDERVAMPDGVELSVDVYRPAEPGSYPVLIELTPYGNNRGPRGGHAAVSDRYRRLAAQGLLVVAVDQRGRSDSDGVFVPFLHDAADGTAIVDWARRLPESDGRVALTGTGYGAFAVLATAAATVVDAVVALAPLGATEGLIDRGGAVRLDRLFWLHLLGSRAVSPADIPDWGAAFRSRPLDRMDEVVGWDDGRWAEWLRSEHPGADIADGLERSGASILLISGWWDPSLASALDYWRVLGQHPDRNAIVVGPWDGATLRAPSAVTGGVDFGVASILEPERLLLDWLTAAFGEGARPASRTFVTGRDEWAAVPPSAAGKRDILHLSSGGSANTRLGDGRLGASPGGTADRATFDPARPVPWQPHRETFSRTAGPALTLDLRHAVERDDMLVYLADPVTVPTLLEGVPEVVLWVEVDTDDADLVVVLEDVFPGGSRAVALTHGVVRLAAQAGFRRGMPGEYRIPLGALAHELQPGHALRLLVAPSLFPLYAVNHGQADYLGGTASGLSHRAIHHDPERPSRLELPLARRSASSASR